MPSRSPCSREYRSRSWWRRIGRRSSRRPAPRSRPARAAARSWRTGGRAAAAGRSAGQRADRGPQSPAAQTTMSAGNSPRSVTTAADAAAVARRDAGHRRARRGTGRRARSRGGPGPRTPGRPWRGRRSGRVAAEHGRRGRAAARPQRTRRGRAAGASMPHEVRQPVPPLQLGEPLRAWSRPRARRPGRKHHCPSSSSALNLSTVYRANSAIVLEPLVWKTRPGGVRAGAAGREQRALVDAP